MRIDALVCVFWVLQFLSIKAPCAISHIGAATSMRQQHPAIGQKCRRFGSRVYDINKWPDSVHRISMPCAHLHMCEGPRTSTERRWPSWLFIILISKTNLRGLNILEFISSFMLHVLRVRSSWTHCMTFLRNNSPSRHMCVCVCDGEKGTKTIKSHENKQNRKRNADNSLDAFKIHATFFSRSTFIMLREEKETVLVCGAQTNNGKNESEFSVSLLSLLPYKARRTIWNVSPGLHHDFYSFSVTLSIENPMRRGSIQHPAPNRDISPFCFHTRSHFSHFTGISIPFGKIIIIIILDLDIFIFTFLTHLTFIRRTWASTAHSIQWERIDCRSCFESLGASGQSFTRSNLYLREIGLSRMCSRRRAFRSRIGNLLCSWVLQRQPKKNIFIRPGADGIAHINFVYKWILML